MEVRDRALFKCSKGVKMAGEPLRELEITDLIGAGGARGPADGAARLRERGQRRAARMVARLPACDGEFDRDRVDALQLRIHYELQRLEDELSLAHLVAQHLKPLVEDIRGDRGGVVRVVDVGCGIGFLLRAIAHGGWLGPGVELVGVDRNPVLVRESRRLADAESLAADFRDGDAFSGSGAIADPDATVVISSGVMHHIPPEDLVAFFAAHERSGVAAFAHWDLQPTAWAVLGSWLFHQARMRSAIARHDGVLSTRRAHTAATLLAAARAGAPSYRAECADGHALVPNPLRVLRPIIGVRKP